MCLPLVPSPGGAHPQIFCKHQNLCLNCSKSSASPSRRMRNRSDSRQSSWWAIEDSGVAAGECDQLFWGYLDAKKANRSSIDHVRKGSGESVESAALVVHIERAVVVISIRVCHRRVHMRVAVGSDWRRLIHVQSMVVNQRDNANHLRDHEERQ